MGLIISFLDRWNPPPNISGQRRSRVEVRSSNRSCGRSAWNLSTTWRCVLFLARTAVGHFASFLLAKSPNSLCQNPEKKKWHSKVSSQVSWHLQSSWPQFLWHQKPPALRSFATWMHRGTCHGRLRELLVGHEGCQWWKHLTSQWFCFGFACKDCLMFYQGHAPL